MINEKKRKSERLKSVPGISSKLREGVNPETAWQQVLGALVSLVYPIEQEAGHGYGHAC